MTDEAAEVLYDDRLEHCPCGERDCPDLVHGEQAHYTVRTTVNGESTGEQRISDPFLSTTTVVGWPDLLRALFRGSLVLNVQVDACRPMTRRVMALTQKDENTLALPHVPCPTCTGGTRETTGLVCQTCGTDYGTGAEAVGW